MHLQSGSATSPSGGRFPTMSSAKACRSCITSGDRTRLQLFASDGGFPQSQKQKRAETLQVKFHEPRYLYIRSFLQERNCSTRLTNTRFAQALLTMLSRDQVGLMCFPQSRAKSPRICTGACQSRFVASYPPEHGLNKTHLDIALIFSPGGS